MGHSGRGLRWRCGCRLVMRAGGLCGSSGLKGGRLIGFRFRMMGLFIRRRVRRLRAGYVVTAGLRHSGFLGELALAVSATIGRATLAAGLGIPDGDLTPAAVTVVFGHAGEGLAGDIAFAAVVLWPFAG